MSKKYKIRCRGIIIHDGKMLVVQHPHNTSFCALPGGHLEWGETVIECIEREIIEELGIKPEIGRLLYINTFFDGDNDVQPMEFFFEIKNVKDYLEFEKLSRSHEHELSDFFWADPKNCPKILPSKLEKDFIEGAVISNETRYINDFK